MSGALAPPSPDAEARSICPLLATPSPTTEIEHPLAVHQLVHQDGDEVVILDTTLPEFKMGEPPRGTLLQQVPQGVTRSGTMQSIPNGDTGSINSVVHVDPNIGSTSDTLLNSSVYYNLNCEENERVKARSIIQHLNKKQNYSFVYWNWPLIRKTCLCSMFSFMILMLCTVVVMIMTQPKNCDPKNNWRRTAMIYEIFPASFQDSNNDGIGDLNGIVYRIPYLKYFGVSIVRLNSIFTTSNYPNDFRSVDTLFKIDPILGDLQDLLQLVDVVHSNNMSIILDLPISHPTYRIDEPSDWGNAHPNDTENVAEVLKFWLDKNVDGFYIKGVEEMQDDHDFIPQLYSWRSLADNYGSKLLVASYHLVENVKIKYGLSHPRMNIVRHTFDLIEIRVNNLNNMTIEAAHLESAYSNMGDSWIMWSLSNNDKQRITPRNTSAAGIMFMFMMPGIPNIFYGEEIGLQNIQLNKAMQEIDAYRTKELIPTSLADRELGQPMEQRHLFQFPPMYWRHFQDQQFALEDFTTMDVTPWIPAAPVTNVDKFETLRAGFEFRTKTPNVYTNGFCREISFMKNLNIRYTDTSIIIIERIYPRRSPFVFIANFGTTYRSIDVSRIFSSGRIVFNITNRVFPNDEFDFEKVNLYPGEAFVVKMYE